MLPGYHVHEQEIDERATIAQAIKMSQDLNGLVIQRQNDRQGYAPRHYRLAKTWNAHRHGDELPNLTFAAAVGQAMEGEERCLIKRNRIGIEEPRPCQCDALVRQRLGSRQRDLGLCFRVLDGAFFAKKLIPTGESQKTGQIHSVGWPAKILLDEF